MNQEPDPWVASVGCTLHRLASTRGCIEPTDSCGKSCARHACCNPVLRNPPGRLVCLGGQQACGRRLVVLLGKTVHGPKERANQGPHAVGLNLHDDQQSNLWNKDLDQRPAHNALPPTFMVSCMMTRQLHPDAKPSMCSGLLRSDRPTSTLNRWYSSKSKAN